MSKIIVDSCVYINAMKEDSIHREQCLGFLSHLAESGKHMTMPAHGWFEVWCNLKRIEKIDKSFKGTSINNLWDIPLELIHIDDKFIGKYGNVEIPYAKAGDHIYLVVAHINNYVLVTTDDGMTKIAKQLNIRVYAPNEYVTAHSVT
jgi:predicted nucleic acid-binding protein